MLKALGLGIMVKGLGCRTFRVQGLGFRVSGLGFGVQRCNQVHVRMKTEDCKTSN